MRLRAWLNDYVRKYLLKVNNIDTETKFTGAGSVSLLLTLSRYSPTWNVSFWKITNFKISSANLGPCHASMTTLFAKITKGS